MKKYLLYLILLCSTGPALSQNFFRFKNYGIKEGLSQSSALNIIQDKTNALWIGTQDGLNKYNGKDVEVFTSDNTEGLENSYISCSAVDNHGNLWFGTNNGLTKYDYLKDQFFTYFLKEGEVFQIKDLTIGSNDVVWVSTVDNGLYSFYPSRKIFESMYGVISSSRTGIIHNISVDLLAVNSSDQGLIVLNTENKETHKIPLNTRSGGIVVNNILNAGSGSTYITTNKGVYQLNEGGTKVKKVFRALYKSHGNLNVTDIKHFTGLGWLIGTKNDGLYVIGDEGGVHQNKNDIYQKNTLLDNTINQLFKDVSGSLWIANQRGVSNVDMNNRGILGVGPSGNPSKGIPAPSVWCFEEDNQGKNIYIGTDVGVSKFNKDRGTFVQYGRINSNQELSGDEPSVLSIQFIRKDYLLVGCADGIFELRTSANGDYEYRNLKFRNNVDSEKHARAYRIEHWKENKYFIATKGGAILYDTQTKQLQTFEHDVENPQSTITKGVCRSLSIDKNGRVLLATSSGGLNLVAEIDDQIVIRPYEFNGNIKSKSKNYITTIHETEKGIYWMGTLGSGLLKWDEKTKVITRFDKSNGLPNDVIYGILEDEKGYLWLTSNKGLVKFNPKNVTIKNYTELQGLMSNEFNSGAYFKSKSNDMYVGGISGYNYFNPEILKGGDIDIDVIFTKIKLENEWLKPSEEEGALLSVPISITKSINLTYRKRGFTIRFQPSDLSNPELVNYKYGLDGDEGEEILLGTDNEIHFTSLQPGSYILKVYGRLEDGKWSSVPATLEINVASPFWMKWWFWLSSLVTLGLLIRWFIRRRIDHARRDQVRLEMKIRDRTKEIKQQNMKIEQQKSAIEEERNKVVEQQKLLQLEKDKTEKLLKNVMPESTAEELKKSGKARARAYRKVSVLFTDFVGFTKVSEKLKPTELVKKLDVYFTKFDKIIVKNNLEKIKTIGDAYMCAGGVPVRNKSNPIDTCIAAIQIQAYMEKRKNDAIANGRDYWELRLGINTGEVTAGVIGSQRLAYDIWGATVNLAQRMEMLGEPGKVTISEATFIEIEPYFECTFKGQAQSKSRGLIEMYVVEGIKPELSVGGDGIIPNERFQQIVNLHLYSSISYYKAERYIMRLLEKQLSKSLHYHGIAHMQDVVSAVERIALLENVTDEGLFLLKSAATYHDAGFIEQYDKNEPIGAQLADEILPKFGYSEKHIERIKELIYVTTIPHKPKNLLEEIICDADLDYLGREDFHEIADKLRRELREHGKIDSDRKWDELQVSFLKMHTYFTKTAIKTRRKKKLEHIKSIEERLKKNNYVD